ncbi:MAG: Ig-like domain-containing protein [Clostridia bacterium]|nr:Ig-like domain-containing protein [Clostridia bacterium]
MSKFKKMTAVLLSVGLFVCCFAVQAGAESIADTAKAFSSGDTKTIKYEGNKEVTSDYSVKLSKKGKIVISISSSGVSNLYVYIYDENGEKYVPDASNFSSGRVYNSIRGIAQCSWNKTVEKLKGTLTYNDMEKGTYYIRFEKQYIWGGSSGSSGKATIKITYPSSESSSGSKLSCVTIPMKVGDAMQLSTDAGTSGITWSSSKSSVATVSSSGKVTAKKAGTAVITAKSGSSTAKIQIKVS